jgi:hypothetical protein
VLRNTNKVVVDKGAAGPGVLPYLPLPELKPNQPAGAHPAPAPGPAVQGAPR